MSDEVIQFHPGVVVMTPTVADTFTPDHVSHVLRRHFSCDWGDVPMSQRALNQRAVLHGDGVVQSSYDIRGDVLCVMTLLGVTTRVLVQSEIPQTENS